MSRIGASQNKSEQIHTNAARRYVERVPRSGSVPAKGSDPTVCCTSSPPLSFFFFFPLHFLSTFEALLSGKTMKRTKINE